MDSGQRKNFSEIVNQVELQRTLMAASDLTHPNSDGISAVDRSSEAGEGTGRSIAARYPLLIALLVLAGSYSILPIWLLMFRLWLNDPLRAIGAIFPLLAFAGTLAAWRGTGWTMNGTFWGLPVIALSIVMARSTTSLILVFQGHAQNQTPLHPGTAMFLYAVGAVLLFGGTRLLRASIAPLLLILVINPVPYAFNTLVDLPLQFLSANTARHFAYLIGLHPSGEQLRMMFTPNFGMMIVPGCNGVRGSVTLGYLALIFGFMRHLRVRILAITTFVAFLMGYVLNLLRLCTLVIYYRIGISHPSIQPYGAAVDYGIGSTLFLFATLGVGIFIRWIEPRQPASEMTAAAAKPASLTPRLNLLVGARAICFVILMLVFIVPTIGQASSLKVALPNEQAVFASFPLQVGRYRIIRTYGEYDNYNLMRYALADYALESNAADPTKTLTFGLYVGSGMHLVAYSRFVQGIRPETTESFDTSDSSAQGPLKIHYVITSFDVDGKREFDAESACYETGCSASIQSSPKMLFFSKPTLADVFHSSNSTRLGILLRRQLPDSDPSEAAIQRAKFENDVREFTSQLNLRTMLHADGSPI